MTDSIPKDFSRWVWGKQAVLDLIKINPQQVEQVLISSTDRDQPKQKIVDLCARAGIPVSIKEGKEINRILPAQTHQNVAARLKAQAQPFVSLEALISKISMDSIPPPVLLVMDHVQDPQNLGAMIRTALGTGVQGVILPKDRSCPVTGSVRKAAAGTLEYMPLVQVTNLVRTLEVLKEKGFWVLSLEADSPVSIYELDLRVPLVVIVGGESQGVSSLVRKRSDWLASIPMEGSVSSLNASVACAVALYEIFRQGRLTKGKG
jgi:23S rRNA (guanosine2251-2'-O)-methyltransferase